MPSPTLNDHDIEQLLSQPTPGAIDAVKQQGSGGWRVWHDETFLR